MNRYSEKKDGALVELTLLGDDHAFEELVIRHEKSVMGTAFKVTENRYFAEDASQDAFVSAWIHLDSLNDGDKFGSWVCAIAKNRARNIVVQYNNTVPDISLEVIEGLELASNDESGIDDLIGIVSLNEQEKYDELRAAVEALGEKIRETVKLHYFEGLSVADISKKLSLPAGTVKWRLSEGRKKLRKEFGVMEKEYNENDRLVEKVLHQVEKLKLWRLKNDKSGFEAEYNLVMASVEALPESKEKQHALADVLELSYWFLPGQKNKETVARIKEAAEKSLNEYAMTLVIFAEWQEHNIKSRPGFILNTQIPYLIEKGFTKALGYAYFWYGVYCLDVNEPEKASDAMRKVLEILTPENIYHANALAALEVIEKKFDPDLDINQKHFGIGATAEEYKMIGDKFCLWAQPGFSRDAHIHSLRSIFWNATACDRTMFDFSLNKDESIVSSDGKNTLTYKGDGYTVETPAGRFENCALWVTEGDYYRLPCAETYFCPGVGIVKQTVKRGCLSTCHNLISYEIKGGEGWFPSAVGNTWSYLPEETDGDGFSYSLENRYEITHVGENSVILYQTYTEKRTGYTDTWNGQMRKARLEYHDYNSLISIGNAHERAAELATTKREKLHTAIASDVMKRIFDTDPGYNPDYTRMGRWNFFSIYNVSRDGNKVKFEEDDRKFSFEWKCMRYGGNNTYQLLYNFFYDLLATAAGCVWCDEWVPGYHLESDGNYYGNPTKLTIDVLEDEDISVIAGNFKNCRHVKVIHEGNFGGSAYFGGEKHYWFAEGVGIVKADFPLGFSDVDITSHWELTEYRGTGEGFFPIDDGLFRRYEPIGLKRGCHGSVEYTFDRDESGTVIFRNAEGTQDREEYEAAIERSKQKNS